jgi:hypothetical protein
VEAAQKWHFISEDIQSSEKTLYILVLASFVTASPDSGHIGGNM